MAREKLTPQALIVVGLCGGVSGGAAAALTVYIFHPREFWLAEISIFVLTLAIMTLLVLLLQAFGILPARNKPLTR